MRRLALGALAGIAATVPMTCAMYMLHRRLPAEQRYPLPPREITQTLAHRAGLNESFREQGPRGLSLLAHYGYGALAGAFYSMLPESTRVSVSRGAGYGIGVWALSYLGWIPAARILKPATEHPRQRVALMLSVHLVWGAGLALNTRCMKKAAGMRGPRDEHSLAR